MNWKTAFTGMIVRNRGIYLTVHFEFSEGWFLRFTCSLN